MKLLNAPRCGTVILLSLLLWCAGTGTARGQQQPGFNRFQYARIKWKTLPTPAFRLYYPAGYDSLASLASVQLPDIAAEVKKLMGNEVRDQPQIVLYPSVLRMYESNIGLYEPALQPFPTINLKGNRMVLAFDGSYAHFREQLKMAWARLVWEEQFRNGAEEQLNSGKPSVPYWFKEGVLHYVAAGWSVAEEDRLQRALLRYPARSAEAWAEQEPALWGQAFCYYMVQQYRADALMQVLFHMRQGKSLPRALRLVTKHRADSLQAQCLRYYSSRTPGALRYTAAADTLTPWLEQHYKGKVQHLQWNRDSSAAVLVLEQYHRRQLYVLSLKDLQDPERNTRLRPFRHYLLPPWFSGHAQDSYPLVQWQDKGNAFTLLLPDKGKLKLFYYTAAGIPAGQPAVLYGIDGADSWAQWNAQQWLLSAHRRGRSDIVVYNAATSRYTPLTTDWADHTGLLLSKGEGLITYRSGYPVDSLYHRDTLAKPYGIYAKAITGDFKQAAATPERAVALDSAYICWQQQASGQDRVLLNTTSGAVQAQPLRAGGPPAGNALTAPPSPWLLDYLRNQRDKDSIRTLLEQAGSGEASFLSKVLLPGDARQAAQLQKDSLRRALAYSGKKVRPYVLQLYSAYFTAQVNNDYFINRYQPYQSYLGAFKFPEVGAMIESGFSDLFENHHFNIGYRMPAGTEGSDFFARYENTAGLTDWHVLFFRKVESLQPDASRDWKDSRGNPYPAAAKVKTHYYEVGFHTPLHYDWSVDYSLAARRDRTIFLATDRYSLDYDNLQSWWGIGNLVLKVRKMQPLIPMLEKGWEGRLLLDGMASTGRQSTMAGGVQLHLSGSLPLYRNITLVARIQGGYSGGQSKILYNFGGLDNNMVTRVDTSVHFAQEAPFAFQTLVTPFRGYEQNSLYGSRYGLLNLDLYVPLFRDLVPLHTGFSSLNNLQLGIFTDQAYASGATGLPPVPSGRGSFGWSARTLLAGYPVRFDMAWPGSFNRPPVWYLSLTLK